MRLRPFLLLIAVAALIEAAAIKYWIDNAGFDCYPHCDAGQQISGWIAVILPVAVATLVAVSILRWLLRHRGAGGKRPVRGS